MISAGDRHGVIWVRGASFRLEGTIGFWRRTGSPVQYATTNDVPVDDSRHAATGWIQLADVTLSFERRWRPGKGDHEVRLAELRIVPVDEGDLPTDIVTRLRLGQLRARMVERLPWASKILTDSSWSDDVRVPRPGRRGRPLFHFAEWAERYVDALKSNPTNPVAQLVAQHGEPPGTIRSWLQRAEDEGLLDRSDNGPGVAGGRLTERCLQVLAEG